MRFSIHTGFIVRGGRDGVRWMTFSSGLLFRSLFRVRECRCFSRLACRADVVSGIDEYGGVGKAALEISLLGASALVE